MFAQETKQNISVLDMDATTIAKKIRNKELSSLEVVNAYIEHIEKINPKLNCFVQDRFKEARKEAKEVDEKIKNGVIEGKLFGVPISIKDSFHVKGMKTTGGLIHRKNAVMNEDAEIVNRLKHEGAIILGKTNTPVLCFCQETDNKLYGRTNNPWDQSRTAGGSSGGEGSLIGAGGAAVGIGADIGGSIRFPSHFNGAIGFKSGNGQIPMEGTFPPVTNPLQQRMFGIGAIGKSVQDAELIHEILSQKHLESRNLSEFQIVIPDNELYYPVNADTKQAIQIVKEILEDQFILIDEEPPHYREAALLWQLIMSIDGAKADLAIVFPNKKAHPFREFLKERLTRKSELHEYYTWAVFGANLFKPTEKKIKEIEEKLRAGDRDIQSYFQRRILILPVYHTAALPHGEVYWQLFSIRKTFLKYIPFVAYANTWGLPSLIVPVSEDQDGLPIGLQIISSVGNESAIFQLGKILEKSTRGYKRAII